MTMKNQTCYHQEQRKFCVCLSAQCCLVCVVCNMLGEQGLTFFLSARSRPIVRYNISGIEDFAKEMEEKNLGKPKISLQFQLSESGLTNLIKAEAAVEENYMVEEEVEIDEDEDNMDNKEIDKATDVDDSSDESEESFKESELKESDENATEPESNSTTTNATSMEEAAKRPKKKTILQQKVSFMLDS